MSVQRFCVDCEQWVDQTQAEPLPGPGNPAWACRPCLALREGHFVGRQHVAPIPPSSGDAA